MPSLDTKLMSRWLKQIAAFHRRKLGDINYIFCSDKRILEVNIEYLGHDYYTDIITFDYDEGQRVSGDLFISLETVASNVGHRLRRRTAARDGSRCFASLRIQG